MALGTPLATLLEMTKAELGSALDADVAPADDAALRQLLSNKQKWWVAAYDWPDLAVVADVDLVASQRYYQFPSTVSRERPIQAEVFYLESWSPVAYGIGRHELLVRNSDQGETQDPVNRWMLHGLEVTSPPPALTGVVGTGTIGAGTYLYYVTYVTSNGETAFSPSLTIEHETGSKNVTLTVPVSSSNYVTARRIYRTKAASTTTAYLLTELGDNTTTTYEDNTPDASLSIVGTEGSGAAVATFEVWPVPATSTTAGLRFRGTMNVPRLENDGDVAVIDDMVLVLSVAADRLARYDSSDARLKLEQAQLIAVRLGATLPKRDQVFSLAGSGRHFQPRQYRYIPSP